MKVYHIATTNLRDSCWDNQRNEEISHCYHITSHRRDRLTAVGIIKEMNKYHIATYTVQK